MKKKDQKQKISMDVLTPNTESAELLLDNNESDIPNDEKSLPSLAAPTPDILDVSLVEKKQSKRKTHPKKESDSEEVQTKELLKTKSKKENTKNKENRKELSKDLDPDFLTNKILDLLKGEPTSFNEKNKTRKKRSTRKSIYTNSTESFNTKPLINEIRAEAEFSANIANIPSSMPVLSLKDSVVFNSMIIPLNEKREFAIEAIESSLANHRMLFVCTEKESELEQPFSQHQLYSTGVVVLILRMIKSAEGNVKILIQGLSRAKARSFTHVKNKNSDFLTAQIELLEDTPIKEGQDIDQEALIRLAREQSEQILNLRGIPLSEIMPALNSINDPSKLADIIAANMRLSVEDALIVLNELDPLERLRKVNDFLAHEIEVALVQTKIQGLAREGMDKAQREYFLREQLKAIRTELGETGSTEEDLENLRELLLKVGLPADVKKETDKQFKRLLSMSSESSEATVVRTYLEWIADLPWKKLSKDVLDIKKAKEILDEDHYGLEKVKDRILEFLSVRKLNPQAKGSILCFAGPPGVGKTSLGKSIARAMGRKFQRLSLGGMRDEAEIRGHRRTYIGSMPGRLIQCLKQAGTKNPIILLDEIDKLASDFRGDPASALLEVLDPEQNVNFSDHYLNVPFDLSKVLFICTANHLENIPGPLKDRLEIINLAGYTEQEKLAIAEKYLVPKQLMDNGLKEEQVTFSSASLADIIHKYTREAGLRNLEREIGAVCRKIARSYAEGDTKKVKLTQKKVEELLGIPRFIDEEKDTHLVPGVAQGLAWTQAGGEVLYVEATTMKGKGNLILTGQLGDVMKESATAALSYARSHAEDFGMEPNFNESIDIHIHVPAGATPKDGPSAGVTITSALISILTNRSVRSDVCMTGEITLRGRVMPVGGIKEKLLAGVARGLKHALIPSQNKKDIEEIPEELRKRITIHTVSHIDEVLSFVLEEK